MINRDGKLVVDEHFTEPLSPFWDVAEVGNGTVRAGGGTLALTVQPSQHTYSNAQIADYRYDDFAFRWRPPLRMTVVARASAAGHTPSVTGHMLSSTEPMPSAAGHTPSSTERTQNDTGRNLNSTGATLGATGRTLVGTAGFGFWNHPFSPDSRRLPHLPQAIWFFFASPPSNMALAFGVPGAGWKAATIDATQPSAIALAPAALPAALLMRVPSLYARLYPRIQRRLKIAETLLDGDLLVERHIYTLEWRAEEARFAVDGATVLQTPFAPRGALGFVTWLDNQYAIVTPQGKLGFGIVPVAQEQTLLLEQVTIELL